jgi:hypothetical protein
LGQEPDYPEDNTNSTVDRRYLQLSHALLDATRLDEIPEPEPLIDGVLFRDSLAWLQGKPGHAKSLTALDWACHIATGRPWRSSAVHAGRVLYVLAEGAGGMNQRRQVWEIGNGTRLEVGQLVFLPVPVQFLRAEDIAALRRIVADLDPVFVVVDTQARVTVGAEENSSRDMGLFVDAADTVRQVCRAAVLCVHHESRVGENMRGSTALEGAATTIVRVTKDGNLVRLDCKKQKDAPEFQPILVRLYPAGESVKLSHDPVGLTEITTDSESHLLATLRDSFRTTGCAGTELRETSKQPKSTFYRALNALVSKGLVVNAGTETRPRYMLTNLPPTDDSPTLSQPVPWDRPSPSPMSHHPLGVGLDGTGPSQEPVSTQPAQFQPELPAAVEATVVACVQCNGPVGEATAAATGGRCSECRTAAANAGGAR